MSEVISTREFHIGDVLSITSGFLVSPRGMEGVTEILDYVTGDHLFTHQLPRAARESEAWLLEQHPYLKNIDCSGMDADSIPLFLEGIVAQHGKMLRIRPLPDGKHEVRDAYQELVEMKGKENVLVIET